MNEFTTDIAIIGGGPAGYSAAVQAAKRGSRVILVERDILGGTCLNHGCIPTKTLLHTFNMLRSMQESARFGVAGNMGMLDIGKLLERRDDVISILHASMAQQLAKYNVENITGQASFNSPHEIKVHTFDDTVKIIHAAKVIIASGSVPKPMKVQGGNSPYILYSNNLLELKSIPSQLIIIGAGAVGLELATIMRRAGSSVCVVEIAPHILPYEDTEITSILERALIRDGIQIYTGSTVHSIESNAHVGKINFTRADVEMSLEADAICVCIGQQPELAHLGLESAGVHYDTNGIKVDEHMRTNIPHIYAAGDATGLSMLAYVANAQGRIAASNATGQNEVMDYNAIPRCVFAAPEVASVGASEIESSAKGIDVRILRSSMAANPYATIIGERRGMVKLVIEVGSSKLLGAQCVGNGAISLISECALAVKLGAATHDLAYTLRPHPSLAEALQEAALTDFD